MPRLTLPPPYISLLSKKTPRPPHQTNKTTKNPIQLGGKGANLCELAKMGVNVPPGLTIPTILCQEYQKTQRLPDWLMPEVFEALEKKIEPAAGGGRKFGCKENPLLLSVRSGAQLSLPGMLSTVLDLGLNDEIVEGLARKTNARFAYDW